MPSYVAGVDSSTQSCKVLVCDALTGRVVRSGSAPHPEGTEVDPNAWWTAFSEAVEAAGGLADVAALGVGGQQHGMVCLDQSGEVIRPALLWNDTRSAGAATDLIRELGDGDETEGKLRWAQATGSVPVASITITKLRWLADNEPDNAAKIAAICLPHDWLTWKISGSTRLEDLVTDRSDASGTGYLDLIESSYRYDLLALGLRITEAAAREIVLPRVAGPSEIVGSGAAARGWGDLKLSPGCGDNAGASLGLGLEPGQASMSIGTSGVIAAVSEEPIYDATGMVTGFQDATGRWLPLACTLNGSRIMDAIAEILSVDYETFSDLALQAPPGAAGLVLIPYFEGERTPNLPEAKASLQGMTLSNSRPNMMARAAVEGLCCLMQEAAEAVRKCGAPVDKVTLVGGGAKSIALRTIAPEVLGIPVEVPQPSEYVALGAARQAAWALTQTTEPPAWEKKGAVIHQRVPTPEVIANYRRMVKAMNF